MRSRNKQRADTAGFTLFELVTVLIILGIISAGITGGMMYAGRIHRAVQVMNQELPQLDTTVRLITKAVRRDGIHVVDRLKYHEEASSSFPAHSLELDGKLILERVHGLQVVSKDAFNGGLGKVVRVTLTMESYSKQGTRAVVFDVMPD